MKRTLLKATATELSFKNNGLLISCESGFILAFAVVAVAVAVVATVVVVAVAVIYF